MAFSTPSLNDFVRVAENGLSSAFFSEGSVLRKGVLKVLARVFAGVAYLVVLLLQKMWKNAFVMTCDVETLVDFGRDYDLPNKPESYAKGLVVVKSDGSAVTIPQGTVFTTDSGIEFECVADTSLSGGIAGTPISVIALASGDDSNCSTGMLLSFRDGTPEHVDESVAVDSEGLSGGTKIEVVVNGNTEYWGESVEEYRARLLNYRRNQPSGGCNADYKGWAERFASVSKCIVEANYPETNSVTCVLAHFSENSDSIAVNSTNVAEVAAYINDEIRRPVTADVRVVSCTEKSVDFTMAISPDNADNRASVRSALKKALRSYVPGDVVSKTDLTVNLKASSSVQSVSVVAVGGGESIELSLSNHELPVIGEITWNEI